MSYFQQPSYQRRPSYQSYNSYAPYNGSNANSNSNLNLQHPGTVTPGTPGDYSMIPSNLMTSPAPSPQFNPISNYQSMTNLNNYNTLEQLNVSRTVILKNLNESLTLSQLLDHMDFGPIEYVKMFSKPAPKNFERTDPEIKNFNVCFISFINSKVSINFTTKYQNLHNLQTLRNALNSKHLKITLNDNKVVNNGLKDFIKLKTLNFIVEYNATRALSVLLKYSPSVPFDDLISDLKVSFKKFGDFEQFKTVDVEGFEDFESDSEIPANSNDYKVLDVQIHFHSIDSAVKCYENCFKSIQAHKKERQTASHFFIGARFTKDRCEPDPANAQSKSKTLDSSPNSENELVIMPNKGLNLQGFDSTPPKEPEDIYSDHSNLNLNSISDVDEDDDDTSYFFNFPRNNSQGSNMNLSSISYQPPSMAPHSTPYSSHIHSPYIPLQRKMSNSGVPFQSPFVSTPHINSPNMNPPNMNGFESHGYMYNPDPYNVGNRTIYLGNLHPSSTVEEIANNVRAGGLVELIKYYPEKRNCFITFIDPNIALKFYLNHQVLHQLIIHGYDITVGWAKTHARPLSRDIALAVTAGASRNVYIGIKVNNDKDGEPQESETKMNLPSEQHLRHDFSHFGEMEQINFYHNNDCVFLNFLNISDAIKLVELFEMKNEEAIGVITNDPGFYERYSNFKISFGKDRCGNPPKFSFKKKLGKSRQKIYFDDSARKQHSPNPITDEAALVFGIIKDDDSKEKESNDILEPSIEPKKPGVVADIEDSEQVKTPSKLKGKFGEEVSDAADDEDDDEDEDEDDDDEDDDISIVIGSDNTSSTTVNNIKDKHEKKKFYNNLVNTSDSFIPLKPKNGSYSNSNSNSTSNSNHNGYSGSRHKHRPAPVSVPQTPNGFMGHSHYGPPPHPMAASPYQSHPHQMSPHPHQMSPHPYPHPGQVQVHGHPGRPQYVQRSNSNYSYYQPQMPFSPQQYPMPPSPMSGGHLVFQGPPPPVQQMYYDSSPTRSSFSGSQVMAQYLAKSQSDDMFYQPHVVYDVDERRRTKK
ncbi:hypothetical protein PSN45_004971 [Yamadazyma tenuis]|uniref:RRM domain-containing protein n=1 Tax=Candida tenuis (strain ATCC 10573 / BCRC 21748 / CBS 615 / JCM 9827 / NBRC 10315 / NRRL Y-1498 / VKM Y-70) TaxID=590646 RepID=G3B2B6_CANTC|nr:uncharacterized protein CANTEDRAFT_133954 [Yamadazyma tenuis ATCC 10573]EGV64638.1 hypothetical protein CANTEDRAFT_133954 [Yamadazyma tenuis ATCC 10573]WEJ97420.1 hypothetical protein PSN45_004971 [Yamadazyma tenuis]